MTTFICACAALLAAGDHAGNWPVFLGPNVLSVDAAELPTEWSPTRNVAWKTKLSGYGQSSPVVWGDHVYVTTVEGPMKDVCRVAAIDMATGVERWSAEFAACTKVTNNNYVSRAAPTPAVDADGVVVFFEGGNVVALGHDGHERWTRELVADFGAIKSNHGLASSVAQDAERVFVWVEREESPYLLALWKSSGDTAWKVDGPGATAWSSPSLLEVEGRTQLVLSASGSLTSHDAATGRRLWRLEGLSGNTSPTPRAVGDGKLLVGATVGRGESGGGGAAASNGLVRIASQGDEFSTEYVWRCKRATSSFGSPAAHAGLAYFVNATGVLFCLDLETGEEVYAERIADSIWATPLAVGDRIYFFGHDGTTTVVAAGREFKKLAENRLWQEDDVPEGPAATPSSDGKGLPPQSSHVLYAAAAVPGALLMRRGDTLYCVRDLEGTVHAAD